MFNKKFLLIFSLFFIAGCSLSGIYLFKQNFKDIETMSAKLEIDVKNVEADTNGVIKSISLKPYSVVKIGDIIAEISQTSNKTSCSQVTNPKQVQETYEDAVIMYKDGIISKEEYDASLAKYKSQKKHSCNPAKSVLVPIYSENDGIFIPDDNYKIGTPVNEDTIIGSIRSEDIIIKAYFSPNDAKRIKVGKKAIITIIKYPEKQLAGIVTSLGKVDINGQAVYLKITDNNSDLNISDGDASIVKILRK